MPISLSTTYEALETTVSFLLGELSSALQGQQAPSSLNFEVSTLYYPEDPQVDIVFVHGLRSNSRTAWSCIDESTGGQICWPAAELPRRLRTKARILAYDYDTYVGTAEYLVSRTLLHQTKRLIEALARRREGSRHRPIVFVCHSLGGLVVKNALIHAKSSQKKELRDVYDAVCGIVFLGTPHTTSPKALADSLSNILDLDSQSKLRHELRNRSTTLACNLERFKPLARGLSIYAIGEISPLSRQDSNLDKQSGSHIYRTLDRDHANLAKFSSRADKDLHRIIDDIADLCAKAMSQERKMSVPPPAFAEGEVHDAEPGKAFETHFWKHTFTLHNAGGESLSLLENYFSRWLGKNSYTTDSDAWPIAILNGLPGSGKTQIALNYVSRHRREYSYILWVNATTRSSLELSYRDIATRIGLDGMTLGDDRKPSRGLKAECLRTVEQAVMEWLAHPRKEKWLLLLDSLSPNSGYPLPPAWTGRLGQHTGAKDWWREFLRNLPSCTGNRGHVIISTRNEVPSIGPRIIPVTKPEEDGLGASVLNQPYTQGKLQDWWQSARKWEKRIVEVALFLSDVSCPRIPLCLFSPDLVEDLESWTSPALKRDGSCLWLENPFLIKGPRLFYHQGFAADDDLAYSTVKMDVQDTHHKQKVSKITTQVDNSIVKVLVQAWEDLSTGLQKIRDRRDLVTAWDDEEQVVQNISALLRNCLTNQALLKRSLGEVNGSLVELADICEAHGEYETARKLYDLERERQDEGDFSLQLDCARLYQQSRQFSDAEARYGKIFSVYRDVFATPGIKTPVDDRITAYRQFASLRASQGRFNEAVNQLTQVLALEDPFGNDSDQVQVTESISELALYLFKSGNEQAASASLQRLLTSLERTRGKTHPETLSIIEVLSTIKVKNGQIDEARRLLDFVYDCQLQRLGERHPKTVLCRSKVAAAMDLGGQAGEAEGIFITCLDAARESLGPRHPALFSIRDDFARCLVSLGKHKEARGELKKLKGEFKNSPGLYSDEVVHRIDRLLACKGKIDYIVVNTGLAARSTLGVGGLYFGDSSFSDGESGHGTGQGWTRD